jgi:hypothetical protein
MTHIAATSNQTESHAAPASPETPTCSAPAAEFYAGEAAEHRALFASIFFPAMFLFFLWLFWSALVEGNGEALLIVSIALPISAVTMAVGPYWALMGRPEPVVRITPEGISDRRWGDSVIPWHEIRSVEGDELMSSGERLAFAGLVAATGNIGTAGIVASSPQKDMQSIALDVPNWDRYFKPSLAVRISLHLLSLTPSLPPRIWIGGLADGREDILAAIARFRPQTDRQNG